MRDARARVLVNYVKHRPTTRLDALPRLCLFNGQTSDLVYDAPAAGAREATSYGFRIHASIAGDRKALRLKIVAPLKDRTQTAETTVSFSILNNETVVCDVTRLLASYRNSKAGAGAAADSEVGPKAPVVREFLIITPQVLIPQEEEALLGVDLPKR